MPDTLLVTEGNRDDVLPADEPEMDSWGFVAELAQPCASARSAGARKTLAPGADARAGEALLVPDTLCWSSKRQQSRWMTCCWVKSWRTSGYLSLPLPRPPHSPRSGASTAAFTTTVTPANYAGWASGSAHPRGIFSMRWQAARRSKTTPGTRRSARHLWKNSVGTRRSTPPEGSSRC